MLSVSKFPKGRKATTEKSFERSFSEKLGVYSRHMSDAMPGLPDRYVPGGIWIEFKSIVFKRDVAFGAGLTVEQEREMTRLSDGGDDVFYCALLQHENGCKMIWLVNWRVRHLLKGRYSLEGLQSMTFMYPDEVSKAVARVLQCR